jgi:hypothetical protein
LWIVDEQLSRKGVGKELIDYMVARTEESWIYIKLLRCAFAPGLFYKEE